MYKLSVADTVRVPVKFTLNDAGKAASFFFHLICDRLDTEEIKSIQQGGESTISDFLRRVTRDWQGQTLVVDDEKKPVPFSPEAFEVMLTCAGVAVLTYQAYFKECSAKEKNS
ncbi:hypothetical protein [Noviherbaspirillum sp. Root189]|uniref:hypothetical protein n=1 Tax=Noviherbaspirillum sp. Root189 TaxID=1736487 RepID=UPI00070B06AC|nr:hypothetical protein [Noviherbaspirillum sp. Root189]KRB73442.1 hypothetical protein ASE07_06210 [Noviherbaspirillum sp. Root189]